MRLTCPRGGAVKSNTYTRNPCGASTAHIIPKHKARPKWQRRCVRLLRLVGRCSLALNHAIRSLLYIYQFLTPPRRHSSGLHDSDNSVGVERNVGSRHRYSDQKMRVDEVAGLSDIDTPVGIERNQSSHDRYPRL